jgi:hypothetical protein
MTRWILGLLLGFFLLAETERTTDVVDPPDKVTKSEVSEDNDKTQSEVSEDNDKDESRDNDEEDEDSWAILHKLKQFYNPAHGEVMDSLRKMRGLQNDSHDAATAWTDRSYLALKGAHIALTRATHDTQNVLHSDAKRIAKMIKGNFADNAAMIDAYSLDEGAKDRIIKEAGLSVVLPPGQFEQGGLDEDFNGRRIYIKSTYDGEYAAFLKNKYARILGYRRELAGWQVELECDPTSEDWDDDVPRDYKPILRRDDFDFAPEPKKQAPRKEKGDQSYRMQKYFVNPHVLVNHIPMSGEPGTPEPKVRSRRRWLHNVCKVIDWDELHQAYKVVHPKTDNWQDDEWSDEELYLLPGRDFHDFTDLTNKTVQVTHFNHTANSAYFGKGRVVAFDKNNLKYKVKIPSQEFELAPKEVEIMERAKKFVTIWAWTEYAEKDDALRRYLTSRELPRAKAQEQVSPEQKEALLRFKKNHNLESMAMEENPLVYKAAEAGRKTWLGAFALGKEKPTAELVKSYAITWEGQKVFKALSELPEPEEYEPVKKFDLQTLFYFLPHDNLRLKKWFQEDLGEPLVTTNKDPDALQEIIDSYEDAIPEEPDATPDDVVSDWVWTKKGAEAMKELIEASKAAADLEAYKSGLLTDDMMQGFLGLPGLDVQDWENVKKPLVVGPHRFHDAMEDEAAKQEEHLNPMKVYVSEGYLESGRIGPIVMVRGSSVNTSEAAESTELIEGAWYLGLIDSAIAKLKTEDIKPEEVMLSDYGYRLTALVPGESGDALEGKPKPVPLGKDKQWKTDWFDPNAHWRPDPSQDDCPSPKWEDTLKEWIRIKDGYSVLGQRFVLSALLEMQASGKAIRRHVSKDEHSMSAKGMFVSSIART